MVRVSFDRDAARERIMKGTRTMVRAVAERALEDSNKLCRRQTGALRNTSFQESDLDRGLLVWRKVYARRMYFTGEPCLDVNPHARLMWAHTARAEFGHVWFEIAARIFRNSM